ncbi:hypothetical protein [Angelakisella massiliensis]|uniref:hypothetical protein n=1 Tax=Angelakisella massiliensis TaxID=1871018 RepID=UPI0011133267|nr:hypothetical protein [Angelakisella massiliensis]
MEKCAAELVITYCFIATNRKGVPSKSTLAAPLNRNMEALKASFKEQCCQPSIVAGSIVFLISFSVKSKASGKNSAPEHHMTCSIH